MLTDSTLFDLTTSRLHELRREAETDRLSRRTRVPIRGLRRVLADGLLGLASWIDDRPRGLRASGLGAAH